jgi:protein O-GlcNAc transferase
VKNRLCLVCLVAAALLAAPAPAQRSDSRPAVPIRNPVEDAWGLVAKGQRQEACQLLREIVQKNPGNVDARLLLGSLLTESGDREEAIRQLNAAVRLRPRSAEAQNALGEAFHTFGDTQAARKPFEMAVSLDPNLAQAQANLGQVLIETGDSEGAAVHLDRAIRLMGTSPDAALPHYLRAKICIAKSDPAGAAAHLNEAVKLLPDFAEAWSDLGQTRKSLLDDPGALAAFERAAKLKPDDAVAQYRLGTEYLRMDRNAEAIEHLRAAYRLNPEDQSTMNGLQLALRRSGQMEEANRIRQALSELLEKKDKARQDALTAIELNNEGALLQKNGDLRGALQKYQEALDLYPEHTGIRTNLAVALLRLGDWTRGIAQLREALRRNPGDAEIRKALDDALAQAPRRR